jgi:hypothetical protein
MRSNEHTASAAGTSAPSWSRTPARMMDLVSLLLFGFAAISIVRLSWAEWLFRSGVPSRMQSAAAVGNSSYLLDLARMERAEVHSNPSQINTLQRAVGLNPRFSPALLDLGLALEREKRLSEAEAVLIQAARVDHQYGPAWALTNFYFRHNDPENFWRWARTATHLAFDDLRPVVELADSMEPRAVHAMDRLDATVRLQRAYMDYLIARERIADAYQVAVVMGRALRKQRNSGIVPDQGDELRLAQFTSRLISAGRADESLQIWRLSGQWKSRGFSSSPDAEITNGEFEQRPSGNGFDWALDPWMSTLATWRPNNLQFTLDGSQPEAAGLMSQWFVLESRKYRLRTEYRTTIRSAKTGLHWALASRSPQEPIGKASQKDEAALAISPTFEASNEASYATSDDWQSVEWLVEPSHAGLAQLRLIYLRDQGSARAVGSFAIRRVQLEKL